MSSSNIFNKPYLGWKDIAELFECGRSKALLIMQAVGVTYVGRKAFIKQEDLKSYLNENGGIKIIWPKSKKRRKR